MKDLKDYICESLLDDEDDLINKSDENLKSSIKNWFKTHITKTIGRLTWKYDKKSNNYIIQWIGHGGGLYIDFDDCYVKDNILLIIKNDRAAVNILHAPENILDKFNDSEALSVNILHSNIENIGTLNNSNEVHTITVNNNIIK